MDDIAAVQQELHTDDQEQATEADIKRVAGGMLDVMVLTHKEVLYRGEVENLTSVNDRGEFDVLSQHANFISLIREKLVVRQKGGKVWEIAISGGVMRVIKNHVRVFLDVGTEGKRGG